MEHLQLCRLHDCCRLCSGHFSDSPGRVILRTRCRPAPPDAITRKWKASQVGCVPIALDEYITSVPAFHIMTSLIEHCPRLDWMVPCPTCTVGVYTAFHKQTQTSVKFWFIECLRAP